MILPANEAAEFSSLMAALDAYTNRRCRCVPGLSDVASMEDAHPEVRVLVRETRWSRPEILEDFVQENPFGLSERALADAHALRHGVKGRFFVERSLKAHTVFVSLGAPERVYGVVGLTRPIEAVISEAQPLGVAALVDAVLLPWRGRIVWDGFVGVVPLFAGPGVRRMFKAAYTRAKERGEVVTSLGEGLAPKPPSRPAPDWRPAVADIVASADRLGKPETALQATTFALLRASAHLAQAALEKDDEALAPALRKVQLALRRVVAQREG